MVKENQEKAATNINSFQILEEKDEDLEEARDKAEKTERRVEEEVMETRSGEEQEVQMEAMDEDSVEEMELGELDLDEIKKECDKKSQGYVSRRQLELLQEAIIKTKAQQQLGISSDAQKGSKRKSLEEELKRGRKTNKQRIAEVGVDLIESCQQLMIMATFYEVNKVSQ